MNKLKIALLLVVSYVTVYAQQPNVILIMADDQGYGDLSCHGNPVLKTPQYIVVGSDTENPIKIYSNEWVGDYCTNTKTLTAGTAKGYWNLEVATDGIYEIELRRWPEESKKTICDSFDGVSPKGAITAAKASLKIAVINESATIQSSDTHVRFTTALKKGKTQLYANFLDKEDKVICGAMYVKIIRK